MKILFAAAEVAPFSKCGGLADVVGSLPKTLVKMGNEIAIFTPFHGCIDSKKYEIKDVENSELRMLFGNQEHVFHLKMCKLPDTNINVFFIDCLYYFGCFREVYPKFLNKRYEHERYITFSLAVMEYAKLLNFKPDVIHANDWHTAMIPLYLKNNYIHDDFYKNSKCVFTIHNLAYQGVIDDLSIIDFATMRKDFVYHAYGIEHYGEVNWMKGAINYADKVIAVSPKYAQEILTSEFGEGMDFTLRMNQPKLVGIVNGIDYDVFNPKTDKNIDFKYDIKSIKNKEKSKKILCEKFGIPYNSKRPLFGFVSRLVPQKGIDLIRICENELRNVDADFIFLGSGNKDYENFLIWISNNSSNVRSWVGYDAKLANLIYAGTDFFLMPSKFEPCGLSQLIAMRFGSLPIVRATGGLEDTITGYPLEDSTGFKFWGYDSWCMTEAIKTAMGVYRDKKVFNAMQKSAMERDFSWKKSAAKYMEVYKEITNL